MHHTVPVQCGVIGFSFRDASPFSDFSLPGAENTNDMGSKFHPKDYLLLNQEARSKKPGLFYPSETPPWYFHQVNQLGKHRAVAEPRRGDPDERYQYHKDSLTH